MNEPDTTDNTSVDTTSSADERAADQRGRAAQVAVMVALAPAVGRISVDPLTGAVDVDNRGAVLSAADAAALEVALQVGEAWRVPVTALSVGGELAESVLRDALAVGAARAVHVEGADDAAPAEVSAALAGVIADLTDSDAAVFVVAGVHGSDVASAAVPAYLAHHLGAVQALGLIAIEADGPGRCEVVRRLDRGARERLAVAAPAVISVEGSVATLRRAGLRAVLAGDDAVIEHVTPQDGVPAAQPELLPRPWRPPTQVVSGPEGVTALDRIRDLTGVAGPTRVSRTIEAEPGEAAEAILDQLAEWGYGPRAAVE
ncbi:MAG TPA: mycofactocin-associated electron transfer flavoprotein beta subunit [Acidimicrobiales bacterium]|nr:mycofactocin-associated electron transfer flavoprotein beta subunit [Acidimicrobiales bacterium]